MLEIAENLHRADLTELERKLQEAEWIELAGKEETAGATCADSLPDGRKAGPQHQQRGINAAVRELGIDRTEAQRAMKIASIMSDERQPGRNE
jgi:ParB family chromosome partitioning protein